MLVHKHHCNKLALARERVGGNLVGIFSRHPFSVTKLSDHPQEALVKLVLKILDKIQSSNQPAFAGVQSQLNQFEELMKICMEDIWAQKKLFPWELRGVGLTKCCEPYNQTCNILDKDLVEQDLWLTLHLILGRLIANGSVAKVNCMKSPREAVPEELWLNVEQEVGLFPCRVEQLIKALSGTQFPSYQKLLEIFCGGSLLQACSACNTSMTVQQ